MNLARLRRTRAHDKHREFWMAEWKILAAFILFNHCTNKSNFSFKMVANENFGQVHLVYHIHLNGGKFRQTARHE